MNRKSPGLLVALVVLSIAARARAQTCSHDCPAAHRDRHGCCPAAVQTGPRCLPGQSATHDTHGHCCWPGQTWSSQRHACAGTPTSCPEHSEVQGEQCVPNRAWALAALATALDGASGAYLESRPPCCGREPGPGITGRPVQWQRHVTTRDRCDLVLAFTTIEGGDGPNAFHRSTDETLHLALATSIETSHGYTDEYRTSIDTSGVHVLIRGAPGVRTWGPVTSVVPGSTYQDGGGAAALVWLLGVEAARAQQIADAMRAAARACGATLAP